MKNIQSSNTQSSNNDSGISRRQVLVGLAAGAATAAFGRSAKAADTGTPGVDLAEGKIKRAVAAKAEPFDLADVRLLDGPFLDAQKRNMKYLLSLDPDRMLHNFRVNAGLQAKAPVYAGWESVQTWAGIRCHGHTLGHYLSACAMMFASTGDDKFKQRCDTIIAELQECQTAAKTGLVNAFPDNMTQFTNAAAGRNFTGVIWYTTHKVLAGIRDVHLFCASQPALEVFTKMGDSVIDVTKNLTDAQFQRMLGTEHGGMNEVMADLYVLTGDKKYLVVAQRFCHHAVLDPLAQGRDVLDNLHSNTQIPKFVGFNRLHVLTGEADYLAASKFFWETVTKNRSFATGGNGDNEHFFAPGTFAQHLASAKTMETCCSHNMLKLTRLLFALYPTAGYADYYEKTLYNAILASQDPDSGMMTYFQPTRPGYMKIFCTPIDSFWCCTGTGMENHAKYGDSIYFKNAEELFVNLFIPSTLSWKEKGLTLTQTTRFPDEANTTIKLALAASATMTLQIRHPAWCQEATVKVNGKVETTSRTPGSYIALNRKWDNGDVVEVSLPMTLRAQPLPGNADTLAMVFGPIVLAGKLGTQGMTRGADIVVNERTIGSMMNQKMDVPALQGDGEKVAESLTPVAGKDLTFNVAVPGREGGMTFVPYFRVAHERYNIYWKVAPKA